ncbi:MAG: hypothetical protein ACK5CA_14935 [Cyanobacteriota bacterium]|jgi:hypothetical protein
MPRQIASAASSSFRAGAGLIPLKFAFKGFVEDGGEQSIQFGSGFGLEVLEAVDLGLEIVEIGNNVALFRQRNTSNYGSLEIRPV